MKKILNQLRNIWLFRLRYPWVRIGHDVHCQSSTTFWSPRRDIIIGSHVGIGGRCIFLADTKIGNKVLIAPQVAFLNVDDHNFDILGRTIWDSGRGDAFRIDVEDDVWIGYGAIILSNTRIGKGSIVSAGSVVRNDVAPYSIVAGVPAKVVKMRFSPEEIVQHEKIIYGITPPLCE